MKKVSPVASLAVRVVLVGTLAGSLGYGGLKVYREYVEKTKVLQAMVERLQADTRVAEVIVTDVQYNPLTQKHMTTIKFLEYDSAGRPMTPKYFSFAGNIIQFQSLVIRFDDLYVRQGDPLRGKSVYLFWKVFVLDGKETQEYVITPINAIPDGYKLEGPGNPVEQRMWQEFWSYALDSKKAISKGIKNAQIEAPGTKFVPGILYSLKIEHDGGIRIDAQPIPAILRLGRIGGHLFFDN